MKPQVYYAVPIRGHMGASATEKHMADNCAKAKKNVDALNIICPEINWVSVAPYDRIVQKLLSKGHVSIEHVLQADFQLGDTCQGLLAHFWDVSGGAEAELERQIGRGKPTLRLDNCPHEIWKCDWDALEDFRDRVVNYHVRRCNP